MNDVKAAAGLRLTGSVKVVCRTPDGRVKWREEGSNLVVNAGLDYILDNGFSATLYLGIKGSGTPAAGDTAASHATWSEVTAYDESTRPEFEYAAASSAVVTNSANKATFTISTDGTAVYGVFLITDSTKGGTTGTLVSAKDFSSVKNADDNDVIEVTYEFTLANAA